MNNPCEAGLIKPCGKTPTEICQCCGLYLCGGHIHELPASSSLGKKDTRPQKGLWAPGKYSCKCHHCDEKFIGDKRALVCADCAYKERNGESV